MFPQLELYTLTGEQLWEDFRDQGNVRPQADVSLTSAQQRAVESIWTAVQAVYSSQIAIYTAVINALNDAVPEGYKNTGQLIGAKVYHLDNCPQLILDNLLTTYGQITPAEKMLNQQQFSEGWNPQEPIMALFIRLEECCMLAMSTKPEYTM